MRPVRKDVGPANTETAYPTFFLKQLDDPFDALATRAFFYCTCRIVVGPRTYRAVVGPPGFELG